MSRGLGSCGCLRLSVPGLRVTSLWSEVSGLLRSADG